MCRPRAIARPPAIVFSAHGVPPSFHDSARDRGLKILDTTCKFVYDIHREAAKALSDGYHLVFIGDPKHREVIGYTNDLDPADYHIVSKIEEAETIDWKHDLEPAWFEGANVVGVTAGSSSPTT